MSPANLWAVQVADFNADGKPDVALLAYAASTVEILLGNGDGTLQTTASIKVPLASAGYDLLVADFNGDGVPDLAVANADANCVTVFLGAGPGAFGSPQTYTSYGAYMLTTGDLNNDGMQTWWWVAAPHRLIYCWETATELLPPPAPSLPPRLRCSHPMPGLPFPLTTLTVTATRTSPR